MIQSILGYQLNDLIFYFFIYAVAGWIMECIYAIYIHKRFVNRGFLYGPYCPIYGAGAVLLIIVLNPLANNMILFIPLAILLTTVIEYIIGWIFETFLHAKLWDYSHSKFNLHGRICLSFSLFWGLLSCVFIKFIQPSVAELIENMPSWLNYHGAYFIVTILVIDLLVAIIKAVRLSDLLQHLEELSHEIYDLVEKIKDATGEQKEHLIDLSQRLKKKYDQQKKNVFTRYKHLFSAFPDINSKQFPNILEEIKKYFKK